MTGRASRSTPIRPTSSLRFGSLSRRDCDKCRSSRKPGAPAITRYISWYDTMKIDILVELTGFSPGNRFRAMSERCAPVQVSFLNHTASSQVPNIDYIITDEICTPSNSDVQSYYSERLWRLPGCFFCFDYRGSEARSRVNRRRSAPDVRLRLLRLWRKTEPRVDRVVGAAPASISSIPRYICATPILLGRQPPAGLESVRVPRHRGDRLTLAQGVDRKALLRSMPRSTSAWTPGPIVAATRRRNRSGWAFPSSACAAPDSARAMAPPWWPPPGAPTLLHERRNNT